jgi:4-carboxymuconolactone decarboxylase
MQNKSPQIAPILPPDWDAAAHEALGTLQGAREYILSRWHADGSAPGMNALGTMARHPALAKAFLTFNNHVSNASTLPARTREILVLRICWLMRAEVEYLQHSLSGRRAGLSDAELEQIRVGPDAPEMAAADVDLVRAVDEIHAHGAVQSATWSRLAAVFDAAQLLDLLFTVGCYDVLAVVFRSIGITSEPGLDPLEPGLRARMNAQ